ncbi:hypothetical protein HPB50_012697 [Hyalomma asiaticum]|uniref:Uncharacterized protein n=1 Tax=Hyalomma asiaticum TaxID=266040 RepID=A0ACB7TJI8_HYAAI|nr:hypothetical protein HPB50_012697 [Hyalomma asiaticum]
MLAYNRDPLAGPEHNPISTAFSFGADTEALLGSNYTEPIELPPTDSVQSDADLLLPYIADNRLFVWPLRGTQCAGAAPRLQTPPTSEGYSGHDTIGNPVMRMPFLTQRCWLVSCELRLTDPLSGDGAFNLRFSY